MFKSGLSIAFFTLISRIFGLARELFIAFLFGTGSTADAVNVAFKLPNLFRRVFAEGAFSSVFIPMFNKKRVESKEEAQKFTGEIFTLLVIILSILVLTLEIFMPYLLYLIAPGFGYSEGKYDLTVFLCRITMPYLIFVSVVSLFGGMLNSVKSFAAFAFSPVILSLCVVVFTLAFQNTIGAAEAVSISVIVAGIFQVLFMFLFLVKKGLTFPLLFSYGDPEVKKLLSNMVPATLSAGAQQLNLFISQSIASFLPGAVSVISYADRIYQFPLSIIGVTFSTLLLPELSKIYKLNHLEYAYRIQNKSIKVSLLLSLPAACGIIILSEPIISLIYERGAFTSSDAENTARVISAFSLGLPAFVISKILTPIFYANHDTKTPLKITVYSLLANTGLNLLLMKPLGVTGIALGSSLAAWYNVFLLYRSASVTGKFKTAPTMPSFIVKCLVNCIIMSIVVFLAKENYGEYLSSESLTVKAFFLFFLITAASGLFFAASWLSGSRSVEKVTPIMERGNW